MREVELREQILALQQQVSRLQAKLSQAEKNGAPPPRRPTAPPPVPAAAPAAAAKPPTPPETPSAAPAPSPSIAASSWSAGGDYRNGGPVVSASWSGGGGGAVAERVLTLKQMREMVEELYASKAKHDAKCADAGLPRETLEQHVYTALNTKYGLRPLIAEYVSACFDGIRRHAAADNDVATFGCIVRSEVDEEFRLVRRAQFIRRNSA